MYLEINQIRVEQQTLTQNLEPLKEEQFSVIEELTIVQGIVKKAMQDSVEKLETSHYHAHNRGNFDTIRTSKGEGYNHKGNF